MKTFLRKYNAIIPADLDNPKLLAELVVHTLRFETRGAEFFPPLPISGTCTVPEHSLSELLEICNIHVQPPVLKKIIYLEQILLRPHFKTFMFEITPAFRMRTKMQIDLGQTIYADANEGWLQGDLWHLLSVFFCFQFDFRIGAFAEPILHKNMVFYPVLEPSINRPNLVFDATLSKRYIDTRIRIVPLTP